MHTKSAYHIHVPHWSHDQPPLWCVEWFAVVYYKPQLGITSDKTVDEKLLIIMKDFCLRKVLNCEFGNENFKAANQHDKIFKSHTSDVCSS